ESSDKEKKWKYMIREEHYKLFYRFRCMIDEYFRKARSDSMPPTYSQRDSMHKDHATPGTALKVGKYSFKPVIRAAQQQLKLEGNNEERFKIITRMIRGSDVFSKVDHMKYVLFHETVVLGLNTLSAIHSLLIRFQSRVLETDIKSIMAIVKPLVAADSTVSNASLLDAVKSGLRKKYFKDSGDLSSN